MKLAVQSFSLSNVLLLLLVHSCRGAEVYHEQGAKPWLASNFPQAHDEACHRRGQQRTEPAAPSSLRCCDPDGVFSDRDWEQIDKALLTPPKIRPCKSVDADSDPSSLVEVQIAVAITRKVYRMMTTCCVRLLVALPLSLVFTYSSI